MKQVDALGRCPSTTTTFKSEEGISHPVQNLRRFWSVSGDAGEQPKKRAKNMYDNVPGKIFLILSLFLHFFNPPCNLCLSLESSNSYFSSHTSSYTKLLNACSQT